jgi:hypothetical protein
VTFAQQKAVSIRPGGICRIVAHFAEIKSCDHIRDRARTAQVAPLAYADHLNDIQPDCAGDKIEFFDVWLIGIICCHVFPFSIIDKEPRAKIAEAL